MPWFKAYTEARWDKKLAQLTLAERGVWFNLLCFTSDQPERGLIDASDRESLALECADGDVDILNSTITKLQRVKHLLTVDGRDGWLSFRTYAARQERKASDKPEATRERKRLERSRKVTRDNGMSRDVTRDSHENGDVTRLDSRYKSIEKEESISLSGKVSNNSVVVGAPERAATAAAGATHEWTQAEAARMARRVAGMLHMKNPNLDGLMAIIRQYPPAQQWLEAQAAGCYEYYSERKQNVSIRLFDNWLKRDEERRRGSASTPSPQQPLATEKVLGNGHTTPDAQPPTVDPLYEFNVARARAKLVS